MKSTTIFKQLILNVVIPVVIALLVLASLNYLQTKNILVQSNNVKNKIIIDEIRNTMEFQDLALGLIEAKLDEKMEWLSNKLVNEIFVSTDSIENLNLTKVQEDLNMDPNMEDIYVINTNGLVVNTTFDEDLHLNFFDFGEDHKNYLLNILKEKKFVSERFTIEQSTRRLKKYTYHPTIDGKYIIEIGFYSADADNLIEAIQKTISDLSNEEAGIVSVDLFIGEINPFSLVSREELGKELHSTLKDVFATEKNKIVEMKTDGKRLTADYIYMERKNTSLYKGSVIQIVTDRSKDRALLAYELLKAIIIFGLTIIAVILLIYNKTKVITRPLKKLVDNVNRIAEGKLEARAEIEGNNEITKLSEHFNYMLERIEEYYNELEQKVKERTAEIEQKKEEIEAQRDALSDKNYRLEVAYEKIEIQNKHITDSIRYAKRIQNAILPPDHLIKQLLRDSFILYKPKDIVSGDFYWIAQKENYILFSAVDCTGHGVPGAFMSIVGNDQLAYIVNVQGIVNPGKILDELNIGVTNSLRRDSAQSNVRDGMDIALCAVDFEERKLQYAGAYNPLYLIRNNELVEYKADKSPIGSHEPDESDKYQNHEIDLLPGDCIYVFSDGYADQFGGPVNKKIMYKRFRQILLDIHKSPMEKQKELLEKNLFEWMGTNEQVDDILVIGVKIN
ncbi:MAG: SpoIIE family protein phosphatase [Bacteroidales bacterium]|nr:SpoIIE family protein phosphatase [Bacteroidales bacterium]